MKEIEKLVTFTYNKFFFENLHFLRSDVETLKKMVLENQKLLNTKLQKTLFISELAEMIKNEKIEEAKKQKTKYGQIIMNDYQSVENLYLWLETGAPEYKSSDMQEVWITDKETLQKLSEYLKERSLIENLDDFYNVMINPDYKDKANWLKSKTLLIYLFQRLAGSYINSETSINSFIEGGFLCKNKLIGNVKQAKNNIKNNGNSKPQNSSLVDEFFNEL